MAGDSEHKPLKPAHPAVKSIAGTFSLLYIRVCSGMASHQLDFLGKITLQGPSEVLLRRAACNPSMSSKLDYS